MLIPGLIFGFALSMCLLALSWATIRAYQSNVVRGERDERNALLEKNHKRKLADCEDTFRDETKGLRKWRDQEWIDARNWRDEECESYERYFNDLKDGNKLRADNVMKMNPYFWFFCHITGQHHLIIKAQLNRFKRAYFDQEVELWIIKHKLLSEAVKNIKLDSSMSESEKDGMLGELGGRVRKLERRKPSLQNFQKQQMILFYDDPDPLSSYSQKIKEQKEIKEFDFS